MFHLIVVVTKALFTVRYFYTEKNRFMNIGAHKKEASHIRERMQDTKIYMCQYFYLNNVLLACNNERSKKI